MILTELKPVDEILKSLGKDKQVFVLACNGCPESAGTGGLEALGRVCSEITGSGVKVSGKTVIDFLCNKVLVRMRASRHKEAIAGADSVVILSCGIGVQAVSAVIEKPVRPALNTVSMGGFQGLWPAEERCRQCGDCVLDSTGGVCPITFCSKSLLNGPCGGSKDGKCETDTEKDCGWHLIYKRLKDTKQADKLRLYHAPRNYKNMYP
ncbi:MAG: methylenetetrahydrofolate reductase C-terminal domain-containing protein, partial [Candidatus Omnitrophota bacterium]